MIDDSLSDTQQFINSKGYQDALKNGMEAVSTQQEKKMSVKELVLKTTNNELKIETVLECFRASVTEDDVECVVYLDRSQAHLLMLYLQEHLNAK